MSFAAPSRCATGGTSSSSSVSGRGAGRGGGRGGGGAGGRCGGRSPSAAGADAQPKRRRRKGDVWRRDRNEWDGGLEEDQDWDETRVGGCWPEAGEGADTEGEEPCGAAAGGGRGAGCHGGASSAATGGRRGGGMVRGDDAGSGLVGAGGSTSAAAVVNQSAEEAMSGVAAVVSLDAGGSSGVAAIIGDDQDTDERIEAHLRAIERSALGGMEAVRAVINAGDGDGANTEGEEACGAAAGGGCRGAEGGSGGLDGVSYTGGVPSTVLVATGRVGERPAPTDGWSGQRAAAAEIDERRGQRVPHARPARMAADEVVAAAGYRLLSLRPWVGDGLAARPASPIHGTADGAARKAAVAAGGAPAVRKPPLKRGPPAGWRARSQLAGGHGSAAGGRGVGRPAGGRRGGGGGSGRGGRRGGSCGTSLLHAPPGAGRAGYASRGPVGGDRLPAWADAPAETDEAESDDEVMEVDEDEDGSDSGADHAPPQARCLQSMPLPATPYDASLWPSPLLRAAVVPDDMIAPRPPGQYYRSLLPPGFQWTLPAREREHGVACEACGGHRSVRGDELLLCDADGCGRCFHMSCLSPPLKRLPNYGAWLCPGCAAVKKEEDKKDKKARREQRKRERDGPEQLSAYEKERLDNIARNQQRLAELGLQ